MKLVTNIHHVTGCSDRKFVDRVPWSRFSVATRQCPLRSDGQMVETCFKVTDRPGDASSCCYS